MPNYKLVVEYNGVNFSGSQIQRETGKESSQRTVQEELEKALAMFFKTENGDGLKTIFSGRTDAGVHAIGQVVNFHSSTEITDLEDNADRTLIAINSQLEADMAVCKIEKVADDFNARFDAKSREYLYKIFNRRHRPVLRLDSLHWEKEPLDFDAMQEHAKKFIGTHDFEKYSAVAKGDEPNNYLCTVFESELVKESKICFKYRIKANRFLRHMVRKIVAELIEVGKGRPVSDEPGMAPANALTLLKVEY